MDFDWNNPPFNLDQSLTLQIIEESFEDPFSLRLLPDSALHPDKARYFNLGKSIANKGIFSVFWTDGKSYRVILAREMTQDEINFYERKNSEIVP